MKTVKLTGIRELRVVDAPDPVLRCDSDVLLRLSVVGVCGSDVHYYTHGNIGSQVVSYPFSVGHECSAVVEAVGADVSDLKPGDRVVVEPAMPCHQCEQCLVGRLNTCRNLKFLGCPGQAEGCLSELMVMPGECCIKMSEAMTMESAALSEPLAIGYYAVQQAESAAGAKAGVLGAGPIGLSVMLCAGVFDAGIELVTDPLEYRLEAAKRAGAARVANPDRSDLVSESGLQDSLDVVFECCGKQQALDQAVELLKPGGTLMLVGIPTEERVSFVIDRIRRKEIRIQNVRRQCGCLEKTLHLMDNGRLDPSFMVTHRFALEDTAKAFELVDNYSDGVIKAMIQIAGPTPSSQNPN